MQGLAQRKGRYGCTRCGLVMVTKASACGEGCDLHYLASKKEARRFRDLWTMQQAGAIKGLRLQPAYSLVVNGIKVGSYRADFRYTDTETGEAVVEDVKSRGSDDGLSKLKRNLVRAIHGVDIKIIGVTR